MSKLVFYWYWPELEWNDYCPMHKRSLTDHPYDDITRLEKGYAILSTVVV